MSAERLSIELDIPVEALPDPHPGLAGYLKSLSVRCTHQKEGRMKVPINLAREPFRRDRPILVASAATAVLLIVVLAMLVSIALTERAAARQTRAELDAVQRQRARIRAEQTNSTPNCAVPITPSCSIATS